MKMLEEIKQDIKSILIQTTKINGRVGALEEYRDETLKPMVREFTQQQGVRQYKKWMIGVFAVALIMAVWSAGYWAFNVAVEDIVDRVVLEKNNELVNKIDEINNKLKEIEFEVEIEI